MCDCGSVSEGCAIVVPGAYAEQVFIIALENKDARNQAISESHQNGLTTEMIFCKLFTEQTRPNKLAKKHLKCSESVER